MEEHFDLEVDYNGNLLVFPARLVQSGFSYKFLVLINGYEVTLELDDEREFRALIDPSALDKNKIDGELIRKVIEKLDRLTG